MSQDTTNYIIIEASEKVAAPLVETTSVTATTVTATEVNGRTETVTVIADIGDADVTLSAAQKKNRLVEVTAASAKNLILGLDAGQWIVVKNNDADTALLVKNKAADTAVSVAATDAALVIAGTNGALITIVTA